MKKLEEIFDESPRKIKAEISKQPTAQPPYLRENKGQKPSFVQSNPELVQQWRKTHATDFYDKKSKLPEITSENVTIYVDDKGNEYSEGFYKWFITLDFSVRQELFGHNFGISQMRFNQNFARDFMNWKPDDSFEAQARRELNEFPELKERFSLSEMAFRLKYKALLRGQFDIIPALSEEELNKIEKLVVEEEPLVVHSPNSMNIQKNYSRLFRQIIIEKSRREKR